MAVRFVFLGLALILCTLGKDAYGQRTTSSKAKLLTSFHFKILTGGIVIVKGTFDDHPDSLNFILDTGSGGISLDSATAKRLQVPLTRSGRTIRGIAGVRTVDFAYDHKLHLPGLNVEHLDFHVNDYEILSSAYGVKIDGIIGYSLFRRYIVAIDYDQRIISFYTQGRFTYPYGGRFLNPSITTLALQQVQVQEEKVVDADFLFDTGAGLCMLFSEDFIEDSAFINPNKKRFHSYGEGLGGKKAMQMTVIKQVKVGPYKFRKVPVFVFADDYNITSYPISKGLIGNDILRRFNVVINYADKVIHIKPNTHFHDEFDYAYTGLEIFLVKDKVVVDDVIPNSPADEAGFKVGDVVIAMNTRFTNDIQAYKQLMQDTGARLKVVVQRNGELIELRLKVGDIR